MHCLPIILISILVCLVPTKKALHMFQQNRYECGRYSAWLKKNWKSQIFQTSIFYWLLCILVFMFVKGIPCLILSMGVAAFYAFFQIQTENQKEYIKPLHYTARVKRQILVISLLQFLIVFLFSFFLPMQFSPLIILADSILAWILIYPMAVLTTPIENAVKKHYLKDAKRILEEHKFLKKIGITGSFGKTSSKNVLQEILSEQFYSLMTPASFNTPMGITITIRTMLKPLHEVFICEMGADHVKDIETLMDFVHPQMGIVTSIGPQHLNTFGSMENIIQEKMKMIEMLPQSGVGFLNMDNEYIRNYQVKNTCKLVTIGIDREDVDYRAVEIEYSPQGSQFYVKTGVGEKILFTTRLLGKHNISNILCAIAVGKELGLSWESLQKAVAKVKYIEHRLEVKKINGYTFIDNAFNSNPVGANMSLEVLKMMPGKRIIVTPGMIDLGEIQEEVNRKFGSSMKDKADIAILVGVNQTLPIVQGLDDCGFDKKNIHVVKTVKEAFALVYQLASKEDTILLENDLPDAFNN